MTLPTELVDVQKGVRRTAASYGLDFYQTVFEMVDWEAMNTVASYEGFPIRYPHWRFGMNFDQISKSYSWGFSKIYELVINNDPCYAYLLKGNALVDQKLVMAHVYAHCDFFKNNLWFAPTNRHMVDELASHATRIQRHISREGLEEVEKFLDSCLSLENLINIYAPYAPDRRRDEERARGAPGVVRFEAKSYMDSFINPPEFIAEQRQKIEAERKRPPRFPERPERDVLFFLMDEAPLRDWQRDVLGMVREEAYYFAPQRLTKVINEGWASYWHAKMMTERLLDPSEVVDFAERHAGAMAVQTGQLNPYKLGIELFRDIEERWNKGRFGKEYEECDDLAVKRKWDTGLGQGRGKIFEVRKIYNDVTFVDEFLTEEFCEEHKLFTHDYNPKTGRREISGRDYREIKDRLLRNLANGGQPVIEVVDGNFRNRGELVLAHRHDGEDLDLAQAKETLKHLYRLWTRPVHVETYVDDRPRRLGYDGESHELVDL
ncbi:MAG: SpoVR family protein [Planctomycetota bacterium]|jgi:stage V sporulation protein R